MSRNLDAAIEALAAAPSLDASYEPWGTDDPARCWRCLGPAGDGASGVCDSCRVVLLGDGPIQPHREPSLADLAAIGAGAAAAFNTWEEAARRFAVAISVNMAPAIRALTKLLAAIEPAEPAPQPWKAAHARRYS